MTVIVLCLLMAGVLPALNIIDKRPATVKKAMQHAVTYLHANIKNTGQFVYRRNLVSGQVDATRYNILRHAGTIYALADYYQDHPISSSERKNLEFASDFLISCCLAPLPDQPDIRSLWSYPDLTGGDHNPKVKLGAAGLALSALTLSRKVGSELDVEAVLRDLGRFLDYMQEPTGRFVSRYNPSRGGKDDTWTSLYYPGEAALGLYYLYEHTGNLNWLRMSVDALRYLSRSRESLDNLPPDHWALIATAKLLHLDDSIMAAVLPDGLEWQSKDGSNSVYKSLLDHAYKIVESILSDQQQRPENLCLGGGFDPTGRVAPTATRLEGLLAALKFVEHGELRTQIVAAAETGIDFLLRAQIQSGSQRGAFTRINPLCNSSHRRAAEIRIDYVQHALSAMLMYQRFWAN